MAATDLVVPLLAFGVFFLVRWSRGHRSLGDAAGYALIIALPYLIFGRSIAIFGDAGPYVQFATIVVATICLGIVIVQWWAKVSPESSLDEPLGGIGPAMQRGRA